MNKKLLGILLGATVCAMTTNPVWTYAMNVYGDGYKSASTEDVVDNQINIDNTTVTINGTSEQIKPSDPVDEVYGGYNDGTGNVVGNTVKIKDTSIGSLRGGLAGNYWAGDGVSGSSMKNHVVLDKVNVSWGVYGGSSAKQSATGNMVEISNNSSVGEVFGGYTGNTAVIDEASTENSGEASNNIVNINNSNTKSVYGGWVHSDSAQANENLVNISGTTVVTGAVYGGYTGTQGAGTSNGDVNKNIVNISSGTVTGAVYGGFSENGKSVSNVVYISKASLGSDVFGNSVYGGYGNNNDSNNNKVYINDNSEIAGTVYGGSSGLTASSNNEVHIKGNSTIKGIVYGGYAYAGTVQQVTGNIVDISSGTLEQSVYGGYSYGSDAESISDNNTVKINNANLKENVYGGHSANGNSNNNKVSIDGNSTVVGVVYGGSSTGAHSSNNAVRIAGNTTINNTVYGGYAHTGTDQEVTGNIVTISSGTVTGNVYGAYSITGKSVNNQVFIDGNSTIAGVVYGGSSSDAQSSNNAVRIAGNTTIKDTIYGGYAYNGTDQEVIGNIVEISSGTIKGKVYGGLSYTGKSSANEVHIIGNAQIAGNIYGGAAEGSKAADANNNIINISSGTIKANVHGGYSSLGDTSANDIYISGDAHINSEYVTAGYAVNGDASNNKIVISGAPTFSSNTKLIGGTGNTAGNNTLEIRSKNVHVSAISGFDHYNFYLPAGISDGDTMLALNTKGNYHISGSTVGIGVQGGSPNLKKGDQVVLISNADGIVANNVNYTKLQQGVSIEYEFTTALSADGKKLVATTAGGRVSEQSKSPVETQAAAIGFVNSGADMVAGSGIQNAVAAGGSNTPEMFGAMGGGTMRHKSGSYADVRGYNLALGFAKTVNNQAGKMTFGPFIEAGWGSYTTHLDSGIRSDGNTNYYGLGVLARQENKNGIYYEGSLRAGILKSDYKSDDLLGGSGYKVRSSYDSSTSYYGIHLAVGKAFKISSKVKADVYTKLMYSHQNGDTVTMQGEGNGETYKFDGVDSVRARLGWRLSKDFGARHTGYVGIAYEYEFAGDAKATVNGFSTPAPSIKGSSGMLELGYILQPKNNQGVAIDIGLQGWMGKKSGINGNVNFIWKI